MIIGHEVAGVVEDLGADVEGLHIGQLVALDPPVPCRQCRVPGRTTSPLPQTRSTSAPTHPAAWPSSSRLTTGNAYPVPPELSPIAASLTEPFADGLEALSRAGGVRGKTVCVFGDGPFGLIICRLAKEQRAAQVILFGHHSERMALAAEDGVTPYDSRQIDIAQTIQHATEGYGAEVIIDTTGARQVIEGALDWLMPARYVGRLHSHRRAPGD